MSTPIFIDESLLDLEHCQDFNRIATTDGNKQIVTKYILTNKIEIKRGQIIDTRKNDIRDRNDGKLIWTGTEAIWLEDDDEIDEYGYIPKQFEVSPEEFDPTTWIDSISYNNIYWPCLSYREQVRDSLVLDDKLTRKYHWYGYFIHKGEKIHVFIEDQGGDSFEFIKNCVMDTSIPFNYHAANFIEMRDENIPSSVIDIKDFDVEYDEDSNNKSVDVELEKNSIFIDGSLLGLKIDPRSSCSVKQAGENKKLVTDYILTNKIEITRGFIINTLKADDRYRNDGKLIWTSTEAIWLDDEIDDYGAVPKEFEVSPKEFSPKYWNESVCHNSYYWPCLSYREQVRDSLVFDDELSEEQYWHGYFSHNGEINHVIIDDGFDDDYVYDPTMCRSLNYCNNGIIYRGMPKRERYSMEFFKEQVMNLNIPFSCYANNIINVKGDDTNISHMYLPGEEEVKTFEITPKESKNVCICKRCNTHLEVSICDNVYMIEPCSECIKVKEDDTKSVDNEDVDWYAEFIKETITVYYQSGPAESIDNSVTISEFLLYGHFLEFVEINNAWSIVNSISLEIFNNEMKKEKYLGDLLSEGIWYGVAIKKEKSATYPNTRNKLYIDVIYPDTHN